MMFRPIRSVEHLACFCNRDVDNLLLEKQCTYGVMAFSESGNYKECSGTSRNGIKLD